MGSAVSEGVDSISGLWMPLCKYHELDIVPNNLAAPNDFLCVLAGINVDVVEVLLYVHRNRKLIKDGSPGRPPRLLRSS